MTSRLLLFFFTSSAVAWAESQPLSQARQALNDGLPSVAIYRLQTLATQIPPADARASALLMAKALSASSRPAEAIPLFEKQPSLSPPDQLELARAYTSVGKSDKAIALYQNLRADPAVAREATSELTTLLLARGRKAEAEAVLTDYQSSHAGDPSIALALAELRLSQDRPQEAVELLDKADSPSPSLRDYLKARAFLDLNKTVEAEKLLQGIKSPSGVLAGKIAVTEAGILVLRKDGSGAEKVIENFIDTNPRSPGLEEVFDALDHIYAQQGAASGAELRRWAEDAHNPSRATLALLYLAKVEGRNGKIDRSRDLYRKFLDQYPESPLVDEARVNLASTFLGAGNMPLVLKTLEAGPKDGQTGFVRGLAQASLGKYQQAVESFSQAANTPQLRESALFNGAVCSALMGIPDADNKALQEIKSGHTSEGLYERVRLTQALFLASQRRPEAGKLLSELASGDSAVVQKARLALAEWDYLELDLKGASNELTQISDPAPAEDERAQSLAVFLADTGEANGEDQVVAKAGAFLKAFPNSSYVPDVRMKLGEILFRRGDYLGAQAQFTAVSEDFPASRLADKAKFLSAQSMARSMDPKAMEEAIEDYDEVVKTGGPFALRARLAQASLFNALQRPKDALGILDTVLKSDPDPEIRYMTLIEKGDTLFSEGPDNPENYRQAVAAWQLIASDPAATSRWTNQALSKMGAAYEKLGDDTAALNCYYSVISKEQATEPEYFWFYKSGFDAGRLLEAQKLWTEAIAVYDKIAALDGPRAEEARSRVNALRLENFLWEK